MRFFIPNVTETETEPVYLEIKKSLVDQLRFPLQERRIFRLNYTNSKRDWQLEVGKFKPQENQYITVAIFEASVYIVMHQTPAGGSGPIVLIDKTEVTNVEDFLQ